MDKVALKQFATAEYNRYSYNNVLTQVEQQINRAADGYLFPPVAITANYTANYNDGVILADATAGNITVTLKPALEMTQKRLVIIKTDASANTVTVDGNAAETINGAATNVLAAQYAKIEICAYSGAWYII